MDDLNGTALYAGILGIMAVALALNTAFRRVETKTAIAGDDDILLKRSRAFGNLDLLLKISYLHKNKNTISLFPKGVNFLKEIESSKKNWNYDLEKIRNIIDYKSYNLKIRNITFVHNKKDTK